jgi:hypothetical protein
MPSCSLCAIDFPALSTDSPCKRCMALQALGVDPEHPNYIQTQVCAAAILYRLNILIPFLLGLETVPSLRNFCTSPCNCPECLKTCLFKPSLRYMGCLLSRGYVHPVSGCDGCPLIGVSTHWFLFSGGEIAPLPSISSASEQRVLAVQTRLRRFPTPTPALSTATIKSRSTSGSSYAEKMITVAYNVSHTSSCLKDKSMLTYHQLGMP